MRFTVLSKVFVYDVRIHDPQSANTEKAVSNILVY